MVTLSFTIFSGQKNYNRAHMLFQVLCGFEPIFYTTHPNEESFYFSSARVYANSDVLTEDSQRLLDSNIDLQYVQSDEYAIAKAKQEDILRNSDFRIGQL